MKPKTDKSDDDDDDDDVDNILMYNKWIIIAFVQRLMTRGMQRSRGSEMLANVETFLNAGWVQINIINSL